MFEHLGKKNLLMYMCSVYQLLKAKGLFLNHDITHGVEGWQKHSLANLLIAMFPLMGSYFGDCYIARDVTCNN